MGGRVGATYLVVTYLCLKVAAPVPCEKCPVDCGPHRMCDLGCWELDTAPQIPMPGHPELLFDCSACWNNARTCHDEPKAEQEWRTRIEQPLERIRVPGCMEEDTIPRSDCTVSAQRPPFTDGDWRCEPIFETEFPRKETP